MDERPDSDRFAELRLIGVDEISVRNRHRYLTAVTDHDNSPDTGHVVWVSEGRTIDERSSNTMNGFFESLSAEVCNAIEFVNIDLSQAYQKAVREGLPNATTAFDTLHVAQLAE